MEKELKRSVSVQIPMSMTLQILSGLSSALCKSYYVSLSYTKINNVIFFVIELI